MKALWVLSLCLCGGWGTAQAQWNGSLVTALRQHQLEKIQEAISHGYPINTTDSDGANLLIWSVFTGDLDAVRYLVSMGGTSPEHGVIFYDHGRSYYGSLACVAVGSGNLGLVRYLDSSLHLSFDEKEYNPRDRQNDGWAPIFYAVNKNDSAIVRYLISRKVSLDIVDEHTSLLSFTAHRDRMKLLGMLLSAGADPSIKDSAGKDLIKDLNQFNHTHVTRLEAYVSSDFYGHYDSLQAMTLGSGNRLVYRSITTRAAVSARRDFGGASRQLLLVANAVYYQGAYKLALPLFLEVAHERQARGEEDFDYADLLNQIGICYDETDENSEALRYYQQSAKAMEGLGLAHLGSYAIVLGNLARLYEGMGRHLEAIDAFRRSIAAYRRSPDRYTLEIVQVIFELGDVFQNIDDNTRATASYQEGLELLDSCQLDADSANAMLLNRLAFKLRHAGSYSEALATVERAIEMLAAVKGKDNTAYADCLDNAGGIYQLMDIYDMQLKYCLEAFNIRKRHLPPDDDDIITSLNNVGFAYERNRRYSQAIDLYNQAITLTLAKHPIDSPGYAMLVHNLARCYTSKKDYKKALPLHYKELQLNRLVNGPNSSEYALSLNTMGEIFEDMNDFARALAYYKKDVALERRLLGEYDELYLHALSSLAEVYLEMRRADISAELFIHSNRSYHNYLRRSTSFLSNDEKMTLLDEDSYRYDYLPSMLYEKTTRLSTRKVAREIYDEQLFMKGLVLQDQKAVLDAVQQSRDSVTRELFRRWREGRTLEGRQMLLAPGKQTVDMDSLADQVRVTEQKLAARSSAFQQSQKIQEAGSGEICRALHEGEAAIEFVKFDLFDTRKHEWGDSTIYAAIILHHNDSFPEFIPLFEETQLYDVITDDSGIVNAGPTVSDLYEEQDEDSRRAPGSLYSLIWRPMASALKGIHKVYYSPVGLLNLVSFDAIKISPDGYLIDSLEMVRTSSTRSICFAPTALQNPGSAALWGNIRYGWDTTAPPPVHPTTVSVHKKARLRLKHLTRGGDGWDDIPGADAEIDSIDNILLANRVRVYVDSGRLATEQRFKSLDGNSPDLIHIATHGFFFGQKKSTKGEDTSAIDLEQMENPMFRSGLVMAGANNLLKGLDRLRGGDDGILTAYEVANLSLANTKLVVLSACQTGLGEVEGSEGVFGMQRAFKIAGVSQIVATLWSIDDSETVELMSLFYHNLFSGMAAREALRGAQLTMRKTHPPFIWGAFVLVD